MAADETELEITLHEQAEFIQTHGKVEMDKIRPMFTEKSAAQLVGARSIYASGRRFRVIKEGARFEGIVTWGEHAWAGYSRPLSVGEIITCNGWRTGMSETTEEANFTAANVPWNALWVQVWPQASLWRPWPLDGYLEPLEVEEAQADGNPYDLVPGEDY